MTLVPQEPIEGELLDPVDPHELLVPAELRGGRLILVACRCGEWEALAAGTPERVRAFAREQHAQHLERVGALPPG